MTATLQSPRRSHYDVVIVGGAIYGSSVAWFLAGNPDFDGSILVVERDPSYEFAATSHTNSCMRQQFSAPINVRISQFGAEYVRNFRAFMGNDERIPTLAFHSFGYLYLAGSESAAQVLRECQQIQAACGAGTRYLSSEDIAREYPFYNLEGIVGGNHNLVDEGYFDGHTMFEWWRRCAREKGTEYLANEVVAMTLDASGSKVTRVRLASGDEVHCGTLVNASGTRASLTARMAGIELPVEARKRYTYVFSAARPLERDLPLTIDPSGVHMRTDNRHYMAGCPPDEDPAVEPDDFSADHSIWEDKVWPVLAHRVPQFDAIRLINSWVGHYDYNTLDQNAVIGRHPQVTNFLFVNGFSGHGLQQSPALGRGTAELILYGDYRSLDLSAFHYERIAEKRPFLEKAII